MADDHNDEIHHSDPDAELRHAIEKYVLKHFAIIAPRSDQELVPVVVKILEHHNIPQRLDQLIATVTAVIFSTAVFRLHVSFKTHSDNSVSVVVPEALANTISHIRHLELLLETHVGSVQISGASFSRVALAMVSLKAHFSQLETLRLHLRINLTIASFEKAKCGDWKKDADDIISSSEFQIGAENMLQQAKELGPGTRKDFRLTVKCRVESDNGRGVMKTQGRPFIVRIGDLEFGSLHDAYGVLSRVWKSFDSTAEGS